MKFRDEAPQEQDLPETVYALKAGTPPAVLCIAVDLQGASDIKSSVYPTATIVPGVLVKE